MDEHDIVQGSIQTPAIDLREAIIYALFHLKSEHKSVSIEVKLEEEPK